MQNSQIEKSASKFELECQKKQRVIVIGFSVSKVFMGGGGAGLVV